MGVNNFENVTPPGVDGRYVYAYLLGGGNMIIVGQVEVYAPFTYGR